MFSNIENLRRFIVIAEHGSMRSAAEVLSVTQPALSRTLHLLEEQCGSPLFERHGRGLRLTPTGESALRHSRHLLRESQIARDDIVASAMGDVGSLRIAAAPVWMSAILPTVILQLRIEHPKLHIRLRTLNFPEAIVGLDQGELDIFCGGFQVKEELPGFLIKKPMFMSKLTIVARQDHPLFKQPLQSMTPLIDYPWVSYLSNRAYFNMIMERVREATGQHCEASIQCDSMLTLLNLIQEGDYLSYLPASFVNMLPEGKVKVLPCPEAEIQFPSGLIFRRSLAGVKAFNNFVMHAEEYVEGSGFTPLS